MMRDRWTDEETEDARYADTRGFFKVEEWLGGPPFGSGHQIGEPRVIARWP